MTKNDLISSQIIDIIDDFLIERGIRIKCESELEEKDRINEEIESAIYGSEYWDLLYSVSDILNDYVPDGETETNGAEFC